MNIISIEDAAKSINEKILFEHISLGITDSDRIGVVGINGAGKSTFLNMVSGAVEPDSGSIVRGNNLKIRHLSQDLRFDGNMTVLEQILQGGNQLMKTVRLYGDIMNRMERAPDDKNLQNMLMEHTSRMDELNAWTLESKAKSILSKLGISDMNRKVGELSGGQRKRIAMAEALIQPADLLILDEPTNHIDLETIEWLEDYLSQQKGALLLVTHDRYFLDRVVDRIIEIDRGRLYSYNGSFEYYLEKKTLQKEVQTSMEKKRRRLYANELAWIRRGARARTTKQKARIQRFEEIKKAGNKITGRQFEIPAAYTRLGKKVVEFDNVSKSFDSEAVIKNFSFLLGRSDRIGIVGPNGAGKTILLNLIAGLTVPDTGSVDIGKTVKVAYYRQNNEDMDPSIRAIDYIRQTAEYVETGNGGSISAGQMLERFLFESSHQYNLINSLSGGEKRRLYLAKVLIEKPNVLL
ncbi:MAG: ATP-binding cassette domain-containing protein, partial [Actinomycetia bacterium]|nr:ATP-binding cassette domain-containing protein [Actinomycetes bacterium]